MKRKRYQASYTIEGALIVPLTIIILIAILYLCFYLHDSLNLNSGLYSYALIHYGAEESEDWSENFFKYMDNKLLIAKSTSISFEQEDNTIDIRTTCHFDLPFEGLNELLGTTYEEKKESCRLSNMRKSNYLRKYKAIAELQKE